MSQAALQAPTTGTVAGLAMVQAINAALAAIASVNAGNADPGAIGAYMWWADTGNSLLKQRDSTNSSWITICPLLTTLLPLAGGNVTGPVNANRGTALASAATVAIGAATGEFLHITGTTTITAFDTVQAGTERTVVFDGILTLTHNATSLILPTAANITTAAGDTARFRSEGGGNWKCVNYQRADGSTLAGNRLQQSAVVATTSGTAIDFTSLPVWATRVTVQLNQVTSASTTGMLLQLGAGSITSAGYVGSSTRLGGSSILSNASTAGALIYTGSASDAVCGNVVFCRMPGTNTWTWSFSLGESGATGNFTHCGGGEISLAGTLDRVRLTSVSGSSAFTAGSASLLIEG